MSEPARSSASGPASGQSPAALRSSPAAPEPSKSCSPGPTPAPDASAISNASPTAAPKSSPDFLQQAPTSSSPERGRDRKHWPRNRQVQVGDRPIPSPNPSRQPPLSP